MVQRLDPIFATLAPGIGDIPRTPGREKVGGTAEQGYLHCGPNGAGHFVKMVHNGIEYGLMAAYAEGFGVLRDANVGKQQHAIDAETTPLRDPEHYQYDLNLRDIAEVWRRGSVIASWLLDLTAAALVKDPDLAKFSGRVSDSGEGRWTIKAAIDEAVRRRCSRPRSTSVSARAARPTSRTSCCRRCASSSADTSRRSSSAVEHTRTPHQPDALQDAHFAEADAAHFRWTTTDRAFASVEDAFLLPRLAALPFPCLEVGCGEGTNLARLAHGGSPVGVDRSPGKARFAGRAVPRARVLAADAFALPFRPGTFAGVLMRDLLHHLETPGEALREAARVLCPGEPWCSSSRTGAIR